MKNYNRYFEAFKEGYNLIGISAAAALSMAIFHPLPLLVGLVAEAAYLMFYADSRWYAVRLAKRFDDEVKARREDLKQKVLPSLDAEMQQRFARLEEMRVNIDARSADQPHWYREVLRKLDFLLEKFLQFALKETQFRTYLASVRDEKLAPDDYANSDNVLPIPRNRWAGGARRDGNKGNQAPKQNAGKKRAQSRDDDGEAWVLATVTELQQNFDGDLAELNQQLETEADEATKTVLRKRVDVLQRRREFIGKIGRIYSNLHHQLNLLEDTFGLISDEICARSPEQVVADIDEVVVQTKSMTELLEEMAPYEQLWAA